LFNIRQVDFVNERIFIEKQRQRAPSKRSLQTRAGILDAAERVFADHGFDGATIRDIAAAAGVQVGLVHHHGGGKADLFARTVARRADALAALRIKALQDARAAAPLTVETVLECFFAPYLDQARTGGPQWLAYARLVAHVSADPRWRTIAAHCFDPTAKVFIDEITLLFPRASRQSIARGFVFSVSSMLAQLTSAWRIAALSDQPAHQDDPLPGLVAFCAAGIRATT
jgi:AcrR family transcriptional regulator